MSGMYLYCQNNECGVYLGSLGGNSCNCCDWVNPDDDSEDERDDEAAQRAHAQKEQSK